ncbi:guanylate kinase [Candidatus Phytoplasma phoenicium]|uniref:Guanylate kinase n=1 Tax=Candidatus Phytoplasma phoenicium TaxID=198422 RepID=A0A0L0MK74_9MOLU|nr:guanylate kinase [Candidatus Phytoplasma phoenicium]KND62695.1 Guanylate kinase [Candidatus Phytoplasma phoenicium]
MKLHKKGLMVVISGPSGVGKGQIKKALFKRKGHNFVYSVSMTTRPPRPEERNGVDYFFVDESYFKQKIKENYFLEYNYFINYYYGTTYRTVTEQLEKGKEIFLEIDVQGSLQVKKHKIRKDGVFIFVAPPSKECLYKRLKNRNTESEAVIQERMKKAEEELLLAHKYDYIVVNDEVENAVDKILAIVVAEHSKIKNSISSYFLISEIFKKES